MQFLAVLLLSVLCLASGSDITEQVFGDIEEGVVAAFGDFNSDELTDVFLIRDNGKTLQILYGAETEPLLRVGPLCVYDNYEITSVVPGDFDGDALMDVLVTLRSSRTNNKELYEVHINWGGSDVLNCSTRAEPNLVAQTIGEPLAIDFNRDMIIDLYGLDEHSERAFWIFNKTRDAPQKRHQAPPSGSNVPRATMTTPNANAYLDLNDDFTADLFVQTDKFYEIWLGRTEESEDFAFNRTIEFTPTGSDYTFGQAVFLDFELKGKENIVLPVCFYKDCSKNSTILVHDGEHFHDVHVNFRDPSSVLWGFVQPTDNDVYLKTITARAGDYNMDGYPDLIVTLKSQTGQIQTFLVENVPCKVCNKPLKRNFEVKWYALMPMGSGIVAGAFYDFYQDGVLDVILMEKTHRGRYRPRAFRNTLDYDANFVKVIVLTGLINKKNPTQRTPLGRKRRTYGTNLPGPRITYTTTTQEGDMQRGSSVQLPQSSYFALQLPYTIFGLGRTPNFVDSLTVGLANKSRTWWQLIPNSQIIVVPKPVEEPSRWKVQLFVTPSKLIMMSVIALGGTCMVIVLIILVLYIKEKREDKQEKLQEAHRFHFDAM